MNKFPKKRKTKQNKLNKKWEETCKVSDKMRWATSCNHPLRNSHMRFLLRHDRHRPNSLLGVPRVLCGFSRVGLIAFSLAIVENQVHPSISEQQQQKKKKGMIFGPINLRNVRYNPAISIKMLLQNKHHRWSYRHKNIMHVT